MLKGKGLNDLLSKAELRKARLAKILPPKAAAKSAAHQGVVERPMEKQLSKSLALKRAQKLGRGTSVGRLNKTREEEEEELEEARGTSAFRLNRSQETEDEPTSVAKLRPDRLTLTSLNLGKLAKKKKPLYGDL